MNSIKAFLFDLDGVIVDTAKYHFIAWQALAQKLGFTFTEQDNERLKGVSRMRSLDILLEIGKQDFSQEEKLKMATEKNELYVSYILQMGPEEILPGVISFLQEARTLGIKIALGSASKNAMTILNRLKISHFFDAIIDGTVVSKAKPDPEVFIKGAYALHQMPQECIVFEDAEAGIEAAINAGMKNVGIGTKDALKRANIVIPGFQNTTVKALLQNFEVSHV